MPSCRSEAIGTPLAKLAAFLAGGFLARLLRPAAPLAAAPTDSGARDPLPELRYLPPVPLAIAVGSTIGLILAGGYLGWTALQSRSEARAVAIALTRGDPAQAPALITRYGCGGCHTIPGARGADGKVAGPLTGMRERVYVGGVVRNSGPNLIAWIVNPPAFSPRTAMPVTGITEEEARHVAAFLYMQ